MEYARKSVRKEDLMRFERFAKEMKQGSFGKDTTGIETDFQWPNETDKKIINNNNNKIF